MRRVHAALAVMMILAPSCQNQNVSRLERELAEARQQLATAQDQADADRARASTGRQLQRARDQLSQLQRSEHATGDVLSVPLLGSLTWRCNNDREFAFTFIPAGATLTVQHSVEDEVTRRQIDPGEKFNGPFSKPAEHQEWVINYRHKPGIISAKLSVVPAVRQGACFIRNFTLEESRQPSHL